MSLLALAVSTIAAQTVAMDASLVTVTLQAQRRLPAEIDVITISLSASDPREWEGAIKIVEDAEQRVRKLVEKEDPKATVTVLTSSGTASPPNGGNVSQQLEIRLAGRAHTQLLATRIGVIKGVTSLSITHDLADRTKALSDARREAVAAARAKAEDYTTAVGRKLGKVQSLVESNETIQPPYQATWVQISTLLTLKIALE